MDILKKKFQISPDNIIFSVLCHKAKFTIKNTSLKTESYEICSPDNDHYKIQSPRKITLAPGMSKTCTVSHFDCGKCSENSFNKVRITNSQKATLLLSLQCPQIPEEEIRFIEFDKKLELSQFNFQKQKDIKIPIKNISMSNLKLSIEIESQFSSLFNFNIEQKQFILLKGKSTFINGHINFTSGAQFLIKVLIKIIPEQFYSQEPIIKTIQITGNALIKKQVAINAFGKNIQNINLTILNGTTTDGEFHLDNNYRKQCQFKLIPEINATNPNQFTSKWLESEINFSEETGIIKAFQKKSIKYKIKTNPTANDINFVQKFSKIGFYDEFNFSKMKLGKHFRKNIEINVKVVFTENNKQELNHPYNFKFRLNIINPALKIHYKSQQNKQLFQIHNQSEIDVPFNLDYHTLYKATPSKGVFDHEKKQPLIIEWKPARPKTGLKSASSTFSLAYGKCDIVLNLPKFQLTIFNFCQRQNIRPSTSTLKKSLGIQRGSQSNLKRPFSAICTQMITKKLKLICDEDFYPDLPKFLPLDKLKNEDIEKIIITSSEKGNIFSNTWTKQISLYFPTKGFLVLKPLKAYLLPYQANVTHYMINDQQFSLMNPVTDKNLNPTFVNLKIKQENYTLGSKQLVFCFNQNKKDFQVENFLPITNIGKNQIKAYLLTVDDQYFVSGQDDKKVTINPNQTVNYRLKLVPNTPNIKETKIVRKIEFMIDGRVETITCFGQLLPVECDFLPKQISFVDSHYGQDEVSQNIVLSNVGFGKFSYKVICPQVVNVSYIQNSGTINGKGSTSITVKFRPCVYLQNYNDYIKILIKGSHVIYIPLKIVTKKPDIIVVQNSLDFGQGVFGDDLETSITLINKNKTTSTCALNFQNSGISFIDGLQYDEFSLYPKEEKKVPLKLKIMQTGIYKQKFKISIASIPGFGTIKGPTHYSYIGKENIMQITPMQLCHNLVIKDLQQSFKINLRSLLKEETIQVRTQLSADQQYDETFLFSVQPQNIKLKSLDEVELSLNSLITDLEKLKQQERRYTLKIFNKGDKKPYSVFRFNIKVPTPKLVIQPSELYFPIIGVNVWNHIKFKIINKGYKQIHFKVKKPSNINFELECKPHVLGNLQISNDRQIQENNNKLTKLNNQAQVRVSFKSKVPVSFQTILTIEDNIGNTYFIKIYGLSTLSPLLLNDTLMSAPVSAKSITSMVSMPTQLSSSTIGTEKVNIVSQYQQNESEEIEHTKFFNFWIGTFMHILKKQNSFHHYLARPEHLLDFLDHFSIDLSKAIGKERPTLQKIILELRKIDIPLDLVNVQRLQANRLGQWNKFMYIFVSKTFIHSDCLKWVSKQINQNIENYDVAFNNYKKVILDILNSLFFKVFKSRVNQFDKMIQKFDPFLEIVYKIECRKHFIILLNMLYHKFSSMSTQKIVSEQLNHLVNVSHNTVYEKTTHCLISNASPEMIYNDGGNGTHTNISGCGYYFTLDRVHLQSNVKLSLKQKCSIAVLNTTLYEKCKMIQYDLQEIQPKIHKVTIQCQDKFSQEWTLDYTAPIDSQYKIQFVGDPQLKCRFSPGGMVKAGRKIPISVTYSPNNLNPHSGTITILNKHFTEIYKIKGKALYSQNIEFEKQIRIYENKKDVQIIQLPWEHPGGQTDRMKQHKSASQEIPVLELVEYNEKRQELKSHKLTVTKQSKRQFSVKIRLQYFFQSPIKKLPLLYQITNQDRTQSKIIRIMVKVLPQPIHIEAQIRCKLQSQLSQKIPLQNLSQQRELVHIEVIKGAQSDREFQRIKTRNSHDSQSSKRNNGQISSRKQDNQFRLSRSGKIFVEPNSIEHINLIYKPQSLYETNYQIRVTFEQSQNVVNYYFKGIPQFPSSYQQPLEITCLAQQPKIFKIPLKSIVRENTEFEIETNLKQLSGKDKITLSYGQTVNYQCQVYCFHAGTIKGQIIFKSPQMSLIYPITLQIQQNLSNAKQYRVNSKVRHPTVMQLQLVNKSKAEVEYDVLYSHPYLICPNKVMIPANDKKVLQVTYLPFEQGQYNAQIRLYHPDMKQIIYQLEMRAEPHEELIQGPIIEMFQPYTFILPIKNTTNIDCYVEKPELPSELCLSKDQVKFPLLLTAGRTLKLELHYKQRQLKNVFHENIVIVTDTIGKFNFICKLEFQQTKNMQEIYIHYQTNKKKDKLALPFKVNFANDFDEKITYNMKFNASNDMKLLKSFKLKSESKQILKPLQKIDLEGEISIEAPALEKSLLSIASSQDLLPPIHFTVSTVKQKINYQFIYPIKLIRIYENPQTITVKANSYQASAALVKLAVVKDVIKWTISDMDTDLVKNCFSFKSINPHQNYLEAIINKPMKYEGYITFYNSKNQAEKMALKVDIGQPRYEHVVISSNVGCKSVTQIQLKNGKGKFKINLQNNKHKQFAVQPCEGQFQLYEGQLVAKVNFVYSPVDYSGLKKAKATVISDQGSYYFNLTGKFKNPNEMKRA